MEIRIKQLGGIVAMFVTKTQHAATLFQRPLVIATFLT